MTFKTLSDDPMFSSPELELRVVATIAADQSGARFWEAADKISPEVFMNHEAYDLMAQVSTAFREKSTMPQVEAKILGDDEFVTALHKLKDYHLRRDLLEVTSEIFRDLRSEKPAKDLLEDASESFEKIKSVAKPAANYTGLIRVVDLLGEQIEAAKKAYALRQANPDAVVGIPTGIRSLDKSLGGLQPGCTYIPAAEPAVGKSSMMRQIGAYAAKNGYAVLYLAFEEEPGRIILKLICSNSRPFLNDKALREGYEDPAVLEQSGPAVAQELKNFYLLPGTSQTTVAEVKARMQMLMQTVPAKGYLFICDYLQDWAKRMRDTREHRLVVANLLSDIRSVCTELKIPALVISSQNRTGYGKGGFGSLKEAGEIEYMADAVFFMSVDDEAVTNEGAKAIKVSIEKNRFGETGQFGLEFQPQYGVFSERTF